MTSLLLATTWFSLLFGLYSLVTATWTTDWVGATMGIILGAGLAAVLTVYERTRAHYSTWVVMACTSLTVALFAGSAGWAIVETRAGALPTVSSLWTFAICAVAAVCSVVWIGWGPGRGGSVPTNAGGKR